MSHEDKQYDLFVSYSSKDKEFVERLVKRVESEERRERHLQCFYAEWDILPGENIVVKLEKGLKDSKFIALVMSPDWERSDWATLERVIPVYEDPAGYKARVLPILRRDCVIPPSVMILKWYNFQNDNNFDKEASRLIARLKGESLRPRDQYEASVKSRVQPVSDTSGPDFQDEVLTSNLFLVLRMPISVSFGYATVRKRSDVWTSLGSDVNVPPFAFKEDTRQVFTFSSLDDSNPLRDVVVRDTLGTLRTTELLSKLPEILIEILNRSMTAHMKNLGMSYDWNNKKTFFPLLGGEPIRYYTWRVGNREFTRTLARSSGSPISYYAHRSCKATFTNFENQLYLKLLPGWHFTTDGIQEPVPSHSMGSLSSRWMNRERNHSVLDDVRFWVFVLSHGSRAILLDVGSETKVEISSTPAFASLDRGIEGDYRERLWFEEAPETDGSANLEEEEQIGRNASS